MKFLSEVPDPRGNPRPLIVTYFDEAHELGETFSVLLRLVDCHDLDLSLWYVFMGTKSDLSYYSPRPGDSQFRRFAG